MYTIITNKPLTPEQNEKLEFFKNHSEECPHAIICLLEGVEIICIATHTSTILEGLHSSSCMCDELMCSSTACAEVELDYTTQALILAEETDCSTGDVLIFTVNPANHYMTSVSRAPGGKLLLSPAVVSCPLTRDLMLLCSKHVISDDYVTTASADDIVIVSPEFTEISHERAMLMANCVEELSANPDWYADIVMSSGEDDTITCSIFNPTNIEELLRVAHLEPSRLNSTPMIPKSVAALTNYWCGLNRTCMVTMVHAPTASVVTIGEVHDDVETTKALVQFRMITLAPIRIKQKIENS